MKSFAILFLFASTAILPRCASADTIANTFLPGQSYQEGPGDGLDNSYYEYAGVAFTPTDNYTLTQIDLAIAAHNDAGNNPIMNVTLNQDSGGAPGPIIESWEGISAPSISPKVVDSSSVASIAVTSGVVLEAGTQYWIVASDPSAISLTWYINAPPGTGGTGGTFGSLIPAFNPVWQSFTENDYDLAFDVLGSPTPEPSTLLLLVIGLAAAAWYKARHRSERHRLVRASFATPFPNRLREI